MADSNDKLTDSIWKLPWMKNENIKLLIIGFIRNDIKTELNHLLTNKTCDSIIFCCANYMKTNDIIHLLNAEPNHRFSSQIFMINSLKWVLHINPHYAPYSNKYKKPENILNGQIYVALHLVSLSPNISYIDAKYQVLFIELNQIYQSQFKFTNKKPIDIQDSQLSVKDIGDLEQLSIKLKIIELNAYDEEDDIINHQIQHCSIDHQINQHNFQAITIRPDTDNENPSFHSDIIKMHSLKWHINYRDYPRLHCDDILDSNIYLFIHYQIFLIDENLRADAYQYLYGNDSAILYLHGEEMWDDDNMPKQLNINLEMTIIDIFDKYGNNITRYYDNHSPKTLQPLSYEWNIPTMNENNKNLLCTGYLRTRSYSMFIPNDIVTICSSFYDNNDVLDEMKNSTKMTHQSFQTQLFLIDSFKFYLEAFPSDFALVLNICSLPTNINKVKIYYKFSMFVGDGDGDGDVNIMATTDCFIQAIFDHDSTYFIWNTNFDIKSLTKEAMIKYKLEMIIMDVHHVNNKKITDYKWMNSLCLQTVTDQYHDIFKIYTKSLMNDKIFSDVVELNSFKLCLEFSSINKWMHIWLRLVSLSPNISSVWFMLKIKCTESDKLEQKLIELTSSTPFRWIDETKNFSQFEWLEFAVTIRLIDVFNKDSIPITNKYINNCLNETNIRNNIIADHTKYKYEYQIPSILSGQQMINVCKGYIRMLTVKNIDDSIYKLCTDYLNDYMDIICQIKAPSVFCTFCSNIFLTGPIKWILIVYPNGMSNNDNGAVQCCLNMIFSEAIISRICVIYSIILTETGTKYTNMKYFDADDYYDFSEFGKIESLQNLNKLQFNLEMNIIDIFDKNGNVIDINSLSIPSKLSFFDEEIWNISDPLTIEKIKSLRFNQAFESPLFTIHSLKWYLRVFSNGTQDTAKEVVICELVLGALPPYITNVDVYFTITLEETNTVYSDFIHFDKASDVQWDTNTLNTADIQDLTSFTFKISIELFGIYDKDGNTITNVFGNNNINTTTSESKNAANTKNITWKISRLERINEIKTAKLYDSFNSDIFQIGELYWMMKLFPNGDSTEDIHTVAWYLCLISSPPYIHQVFIRYIINLQETDTNTMDLANFNIESTECGWSKEELETKQIKKIDSLTFNLFMEVIDIFDQNGNKIDMKSNVDYMRSNVVIEAISYEWKINEFDTLKQIKTDKYGLKVCSEYFKMYGLNWRLELYPNGKQKDETGNLDIFLTLDSKALSSEIAGVSIFDTLLLEELHVLQEGFVQFTNDRLSIPYKGSIFDMKDIQYLDTITLKLTMKLINIYDINNNIITTKFIENNLLKSTNNDIKWNSVLLSQLNDLINIFQ